MLSWQRHRRYPEQSEKYHFFKRSLKEINIISDCLLIARKAWNRLVIFQQRDIAS